MLFSIGVILISKFAGNVHLDLDAVLLGELAFAPFDRVQIGGWDLGPKGLWVMGTILVLNVVLVIAFFKELKLATFDPALAASLGFAPALLHYGLMSVVSVTAVGAFDAVGSILVVALMIGPPAAAYLLTDDLKRMLVLSVLIGVFSSIAGLLAGALARRFDCRSDGDHHWYRLPGRAAVCSGPRSGGAGATARAAEGRLRADDAGDPCHEPRRYRRRDCPRTGWTGWKSICTGIRGLRHESSTWRAGMGS